MSTNIPYGFASPLALDIDSSGSIFVVGYSQFKVDFGGGMQDSEGTQPGFILKISGQGKYIWSKSLVGALGSQLASVLSLSDGSVVAGGRFKGPQVSLGDITIDNANQTDNPYASTDDALLVRVDSAGDAVWMKGFGGEEAESMWEVALLPGGDIAVAGTFNSPEFSIGSGKLFLSEQAQQDASGTDVFVARLDGSGGDVWSIAFGGESVESVAGMAVETGKLVLAGHFVSPSVDFGGGALEGSEGNSIWIGAYSFDGDSIWSTAFGSVYNANTYALSAMPGGQIALVGRSHDTDFGGGMIPKGAYVVSFSQ